MPLSILGVAIECKLAVRKISSITISAAELRSSFFRSIVQVSCQPGSYGMLDTVL